MAKPTNSFRIGELQVALWGTDEEKTSRVSVQKSRYNREKKEYENQTVWLNATELNCLINLLRRAERALVNNDAS